MAIDASLYALEFYDEEEYKIAVILPILSSLYRRMGMPQNAIELLKKYPAFRWQTPIYYTSIGAAYADINDKENALKFANMAYALYKSQNIKDNYELKNLYSRINSL